MQDIKIKNYKRLILSVFIGASLISIMQVTILQVLLTCLICFVVLVLLHLKKSENGQEAKLQSLRPSTIGH